MANLLQLDKLDIRHGPVFSHTFMALQAAVHGQGIVLANKILAQHEIENETYKLCYLSLYRIQNLFMW